MNGEPQLITHNPDGGAPVRKSYPLPSFTEVPEIDEPGTQAMMRAIQTSFDVLSFMVYL